MVTPQILVVDDQVDVLDELASYLRRRGETVLTASSYNDALRILKDGATPIDVLISDERLPDGNGMDLIRRQVERTCDRPICFLITGHLEQKQISADLRDVKVFRKPFTLSILYREVKAALASRQGQVNGSMAPDLVKQI